MSDTWNMSVAGRSYGPYALAQMQTFVTEGRLAAHSLVARTGRDIFRPASEDDQLAKLFGPVKAPIPSASGKFLTAGRTGGNDLPDLSAGRAQGEIRGAERGRFLILADMKTGSISALVEEMQKMGETLQLFSRAWLLISDQTINNVRNTLVRKLGKTDVLFVVDATRNKAAWFNFGLEVDSRIRRVWSAQSDTPPVRSAAG